MHLIQIQKHVIQINNKIHTATDKKAALEAGFKN